MTYLEIITKVAESTGLNRNLVDKAYRAYWKSVREHICSLPLKEDLTDEEFLKLQPNVNIPSIGKLHVTLDRYHRMKKFNSILEEKKQLKIKENVTHKEN